MPKLTKALVAAIEPPDSGTETTWDTAVRGFGVRMTEKGVRSYLAKYRTRAGRVRWMVIGRVGTITLDEARAEAARIMGAVARGDDPAGDRQAERAAETFAQLVDLYERDGLVVQRGIRQGEPMKDATAANTMARIRSHAVPLLGTRKARDLDAGDIERMVRDIAKGKTARDEKVGPHKRVIVRGGEGVARKVARDLSALFSFAMRRGIITANPVATAAIRKTDNRRERFLTLPELQKFGAAVDALEQEGRLPGKAATIVRLLALTGCRRDEIAGLKWSEVDLKGGRLVLEATKTGKSVRPLNGAAQTILAALYPTRDAASGWVFPASSGGGHYIGMRRYWPAIAAKAGLPGITPHVLRHSVGSIAASSGEALLIVGAMLGHANPRSTAIYAHVAEDPAARAANRVGDAIAAAMAGNRAADVVPLHTATAG